MNSPVRRKVGSPHRRHRHPRRRSHGAASARVSNARAAGRTTRARPAASQQPARDCSEVAMAEKRITVWVQHYADRPFLLFQWVDPETGKRKSKSAETNNPLEAEKKRSDLEYELNHGLHMEPSKVTWERF